MAPTWTATELAYLAGIIDGEGSIALSGGRGRHVFSCQLIVGNTDPKLIYWLHERFGGTINLRKKRPSPKQKQLWIWLLSGTSIEALLVAVLPFLVIKHAQASVILEYRKTVAPVGFNHHLSDDVREQRLQLKASLLTLNQRGVANG